MVTAPAFARLTESHARELCDGSGLKAETIYAAGIYSASGAEASALLGYGVGPALVFPYAWDDGGLPSYARLKLDHAGPDGKRYRSPAGRSNRLYVPARVLASPGDLVSVAVPLLVTEGEKKTLAACQAGLVCVGLSGVWSWRTRRDDGASVPIADLDEVPWTGRDVWVCLDSDAASNPDVARAERELATELTRRGARVSIVRLPAGPAGTKQGLDDFLVAHGRAAFDALPRIPALPVAAPVTLAVEGAGAFLAHQYADPAPLVDGLLSSDGGGFLGGEEKLGKSIYMIEEAACLACALEVCGRFAVPARRRVLILEEEDSPRRTQRRLRAILRGHGLDPDEVTVREDLDAWLRLSVWSGFTLDDRAWVAQLEAEIAAFRPAVVYLDALRKVTGRDLNKAAEASAVLAVLDDLRRRYGCVFRVIHHYRKTQGFRAGRGSQEMAGSYVLGAWAENSLFFEPIGRKQGAVRVEIQSKDAPPQPGFTLRMEAEGPLWNPTTLRLSADLDAPEDLADDLVLQAVAALPKQEPVTGQPGVSVKALKDALKKGDKTIRRALDRLCADERCLVTGTATKQAKLYGVNAQ